MNTHIFTSTSVITCCKVHWSLTTNSCIFPRYWIVINCSPVFWNASTYDVCLIPASRIDIPSLTTQPSIARYNSWAGRLICSYNEHNNNPVYCKWLFQNCNSVIIVITDLISVIVINNSHPPTHHSSLLILERYSKKWLFVSLQIKWIISYWEMIKHLCYEWAVHLLKILR